MDSQKIDFAIRVDVDDLNLPPALVITGNHERRSSSRGSLIGMGAGTAPLPLPGPTVVPDGAASRDEAAGGALAAERLS